MKVLLVCTLSVHLAFSSTLPILENHGTIHSLAQRSKELHVSVDADAYMNDVSPLYWVLPLPNLLLRHLLNNIRSSTISHYSSTIVI